MEGRETSMIFSAVLTILWRVLRSKVVQFPNQGCYCATAQEKGPTNGFTRSGPWVPQNSTTIVCAGYVSPHPVLLGMGKCIHLRPWAHYSWITTTSPVLWQFTIGHRTTDPHYIPIPLQGCHGAIPQGTAIGVTASAIAVHLHIIDASGPDFWHLLLHLLYKYLTLTSCHMQHHFRWCGRDYSPWNTGVLAHQ
ncbi:hypothetical protein P4O66_001249, partial [Electrophorus voltai]